MSWEQVGMQAASGVIGTGLGLALGAYNDRRQLRQQGKLTAQQVAAQKELGLFNQGLAIDTWNKTNYAEQRKQMEKAGLNIGLMYGGTGAGGTTAGGNAGSVTGGNAPAGGNEVGMGIESAMQIALMKAQKENIEADTANKQADLPVKGQDVKTGIQTEARTKAEAELKDLEAKQKRATTKHEIETIEAEKRRVRAEAGIAESEETVAKSTIAYKQLQEKWEYQLTKAQTAAQEANIIKTNADTQAVKKGMEKVTAEIKTMLSKNQREWAQLTIQEKEFYIKKAMADNATATTEFNTSTPQQIRQWIGIVSDLIPFAGGQ